MAAENVRIKNGYTGEDTYQILGVEGKEAAADITRLVTENGGTNTLFLEDVTSSKPLAVKPGVVADLTGVYEASFFPVTLAGNKLVNDWDSTVKEGTDYTWTLIPGDPDDPESGYQSGSTLSVTREGYYTLYCVWPAPGITIAVASIIHVTNDGSAAGNTNTAANGTSASTVTGTVPGEKLRGQNGNFTYKISDVLSTEVKSLTIDGVPEEVTVYKVPSAAVSFSIAYDNEEDRLWLPTATYAYLPQADGSYKKGGGRATQELNPNNKHQIKIDEKESNWRNPTSEYIYGVIIDSSSGPQPLFYYQFSNESAPAPTVAPSPCAVTLDGKPITLNAYLFTEGSGGTNYVMLRDIAALLNGSKAQFEVAWDKDKGIAITTGKAYTPVGGELQGKGNDSKPFAANASTITIDGKAVELTAYTIEWNNYFKLRDLGEALGFGVDWDAATGTVVIDTAKH